ncbi:MAG: hypothetical protein Q8K75_01620 [Chlamydiales bacterium]|nr:hypothetical protein [Chlamydiales bacterium]
MVEAQEALKHIASLLQIHLLREYKTGDWLDSDIEACEFFRNRLATAGSKPVVKEAAPRPVVSAPITPPKPMPVPMRPTPRPAPVVVQEKAPEPQAMPKIESTVERRTTKRHSTEASDWKGVLKQVAPNLTILDTPPEHVEPKIWILADPAMPAMQQTLLNNIARAISMTFEPACVAKELKANVSAKLVLGSSAIDHEHFMMLPALDLMLEDPDQKTALWQQLADKLCTSL